ncbi:SprT family zinc-dependent metalloprotease [Yoonia sp.]|uniref:M48 family metallopeptidase n=1 Tax=Yoonia sp. TaxID=2212373 RepID=UPI0025FD94D0|nr:SprT family zinc-dependent metalloprotease [Yoonia sp.]
MGRHTLHGNPPIEVELRRSARAKRLSLRVSRLDGRVTLTLPERSPDREGIAFLHAREAWLRGHLMLIAPVHTVAVGGTVPFEGRNLLIVTGEARRARLEAARFVVPAGDRVGARVKALLKATARDRLAAASDHYAAKLGHSYTRLSIRDTRSRWGSCSSQGVLMYSWRLIMAPPEVLRYVAAHEVAHLTEMNHAPAFWAVVAKLFPDYQARRQWLRDHGDQLHRIQFDD